MNPEKIARTLTDLYTEIVEKCGTPRNGPKSLENVFIEFAQSKGIPLSMDDLEAAYDKKNNTRNSH